jgi:hypothetical protein
VKYAREPEPACTRRHAEVVARPAGGAVRRAVSAVQQLAAAIGSATVTTLYFTQLHHGGPGHAMALSVVVAVAVIAAACLGPARLLPRAAAAEAA